MRAGLSDRGRVLIVDDDRKILDLLIELLSDEGYEVSSAEDGAEGLRLATSSELDLVISDVVMPVVDGLELCRRLKEDQRTAYIPVLLVSGIRMSSDDGVRGLYAGADDYLELPFRNDELLVKVARLVERHRIEKHYREIVEQAADIIYSRDMDGFLTSINEAGARFFGRSVSELVGKHLSELIPKESAAEDIANAKNYSGIPPVRSTYQLHNAKGDSRCLEGVITVERDRRGRALGVRGVVRDITDQKLAEEALKESEERYRLLVELLPEAVVIHSGGKFVYLNAAAQKLWGASSAEELIGRSILEVVHPDYHEAVRQRVKQIEQLKEATLLAEQKCIKLDGSVIDVEVSGIPFMSGGKPAVQAIFRDVTEQKRAREALRETEARLRTVVGSASLILFATDKNGIFTLSEGEGLASLSLKPGELVGQSVFDVYADTPRVCENIRRALDGESFADAVDVGGLTFEVRYSPLIDDSENILGIIGVATDITENRRAEASIRESEERYRELFENANDIIFILDFDGKILSCNAAAAKTYGYETGQMLGLSLETLLDKRYLPVVRELFGRKRGEVDVPNPLQFLTYTRTGEAVWVEVNTRSIRENGKPVAIHGIARNITERKRMEEALKKREQELEEKSRNLEDANTALKVLLKRREDDKAELEEKVTCNVRELILPYIENMKITPVDSHQLNQLKILERNLNEIISPFLRTLSSKYPNLTPTEIKVINFIREGRTTKEMAELLNASARTVEVHRDNIRKKLGLRNRKANLKSYLLSL